MNTDLDDERIEEWRMVEEMCRLCGFLNHSSGIVSKIERLEEIAWRLNRTDYAGFPRPSFMTWLKRIITEKSEQQQQP